LRYFVTGGAGFIGSNFVRGLIDGRWGEQVDSVTVFDSFSYAGNIMNLEPVSLDPRLTIIHGDIRNQSEIISALPNHDVVVHFAAESHVDRSIHSSAVFIETNVLGTHNLLEASKQLNINKFIHVSTDEVYGSIPEGSWDENEPLLPNSPYAASKAASDLIVRSYSRTYNFPICTTRCSNNFGIFQFPEKVIPLFITNLFDGLKIPLYGDGLNIRDWLHVDDHCRAIHLVIENGKSGEIYNIGGGTELTNLELTHLILNRMNCDESMMQPVQDRLGHDRRYSVDWTKIRDELGYAPAFTLENSIDEIISWYQTNENWWRPLKK